MKYMLVEYARNGQMICLFKKETKKNLVTQCN